MYYPIEIVLKNYNPSLLEKGMLFQTKYFPDTDREFLEIWELKKVPINSKIFIQENGFPIKLCIIDDEGIIVASHEEIGWWDDGNEELRKITLKDINNIFQQSGGLAEIDISEFYFTNDIISPRLFEGRIILRQLTEEYIEE